MEGATRGRRRRSRGERTKDVLAFIFPLGAAALIYSICLSSTTLALIGLSLTFWGILFLFILPGGYVEREVLDSMVSSSLSAVNRLIEDSRCQGRGIYLPPYPKDVYLPLSHLRKLRDGVLYVPTRGGKPEVQVQEAFAENPKGLSIVPPGLSLAKLIEKRMATDLFSSDTEFLTETLPSILVDDMGLARDVSISFNNDSFLVKIRELSCRQLCEEVSTLTSICSNIGCPLISSIACLLAKVGGKPVIIEGCRLIDGVTEVQYSVLGR